MPESSQDEVVNANSDNAYRGLTILGIFCVFALPFAMWRWRTYAKQKSLGYWNWRNPLFVTLGAWIFVFTIIYVGIATGGGSV